MKFKIFKLLEGQAGEYLHNCRIWKTIISKKIRLQTKEDKTDQLKSGTFPLTVCKKRLYPQAV